MRPRTVTIRVVREFAHPIADCYAWLTDYRDDDPQRTTAVLRSRPVIERHKDRVVLQVENVLMGRAVRGRAEVRFFPQHWRYEARSLEGDGKAILYTYQLEEIDDARTRLVVEYTTRARSWKTYWRVLLAAPFARVEIHRMWDGFTRAMDAELAVIQWRRK